jgi:hypothetical protein
MRKAIGPLAVPGIALLATGAVMADPPTVSWYHGASGDTVTVNPVQWDNMPNGYGTSFLSSQLETAYPFDSQVADDFRFDDGTYDITDVFWIGGYWNGDPTPGSAFNIIFYNDAGGLPTGGPDDPTPTAKAVYTVPWAQVNEINNGDGTYSYDVELDTAFTAVQGQHYWLAIQYVGFYPPQWGWAPALHSHQLFDAHQGFPLLGTDYWAPVDPATDMAFKLSGVPAPGTLALLALAGLVTRRRRRA